MGLNLVTLGLCKKSTYVLALLSLIASCRGRAMGQEASAELLRELQVEQQENRTVIGQHYDGALHFIDATLPNKRFRLASQYGVEKDGPILTLTDGAESQTSKGEWVASCRHRGNCNITNKQDGTKKLVVKFKGLLSALYWSPDQNFVFYVIKAPKWRFPARCGGDTERDVILHQISSGLHGVLTTICGPDDLRWYQFEKPLPPRPGLIKRSN
jgi:hypothetical protein